MKTFAGVVDLAMEVAMIADEIYERTQEDAKLIVLVGNHAWQKLRTEQVQDSVADPRRHTPAGLELLGHPVMRSGDTPSDGVRIMLDLGQSGELR